MLLAVVIPVYNERELLPKLIERLDATERPHGPDGLAMTRHLFLVDDGSTDGTLDLLADLDRREDVTCLYAERNKGKGSALRRGFAAAMERGCDLAIVQDADLEYDPADHGARPGADRGRARRRGDRHAVPRRDPPRALLLALGRQPGHHALSNMLSNLNLTDIECGTKAFDAVTLRLLLPRLKENRFGIEPEIVAKLAKLRLPDGRGGERAPRIFEVPISYAGRTYAEGKKIGWRDGVEAIRCILQHNLFS
jgi:glycosyltransferase involved in cell wall biosynthesis